MAVVEQHISAVKVECVQGKSVLPLAEFALEQAVVLDELVERSAARDLYMKSVTWYLELSKAFPANSGYKQR